MTGDQLYSALSLIPRGQRWRDVAVSVGGVLYDVESVRNGADEYGGDCLVISIPADQEP